MTIFIGLGGTGAYVLDFVAKTPVKEIHLFDGDSFGQHNAFRAPGAATVEELKARPSKVSYHERRYSSIRKGIVAHPEHVTAESRNELARLSFVFLCIDSVVGRRAVAALLHELGIAFVDVGLGVQIADGQLFGQVRATSSELLRPQEDSDQPAEVAVAAPVRNDYETNIQIVELNALNAALAVAHWKRVRGFYLSSGPVHESIYVLHSGRTQTRGVRDA